MDELFSVISALKRFILIELFEFLSSFIKTYSSSAIDIGQPNLFILLMNSSLFSWI